MKKRIPAVFVLILSALSLWAQDSGQNSAQTANIAGTWQVSWQSRRGNEQASVQIQQDSSTLSGNFSGSNGSSPLTGAVQGNQVSFSVQMKGRRTFTLVYTGTFDGDKMSGTLQRQNSEGRGGSRAEQQERTWTATRAQSNPGSQSRPDQSQETGEQDGL